MKERRLTGLRNRLLQELAQVAPGGQSTRVRLHRARGVKIGENVWIGYDAVLETAYPELITIEDDASIGIRSVIIAHFKESRGVKIEREAFIGPGVIILPGVVVGSGSVVTAGSVVTRSVPAMTVAQGNPATPVAACGVPLRSGVSIREFSKALTRLG